MMCRSILMTDTSLVLFLQPTLCSQGLAACCDEPNPVFEIFWKLRAFDLLTEGIKTNKKNSLIKRMLSKSLDLF